MGHQAFLKTPRVKPKPSKELLELVKAAKAKSKAHGSRKRDGDFTRAPAVVEKGAFS